MISDDKDIYCKKEEIYLIMSSAKKLKQIRNGHRSHIKRLVGDINGFKEDIVHLKAIQNNIASKISVIKDLDEEILEAIDEDDENFENISKIENFIISIEKKVRRQFQLHLLAKQKIN